MRSKKLQGVFSNFTEKIASVLEDELTGNTELISAYVKYPHKPKSKSKSPGQPISNLESVSNRDAKSPFSSRMYYPEKPPPTL